MIRVVRVSLLACLSCVDDIQFAALQSEVKKVSNTRQTIHPSPDTSIWKDIKYLFADGGWLHDIFLIDCSSEDQLALLRFFTNGQFRTTVRDGKKVEIAPVASPKNIELYFADHDDHYLMTLYIGGCILNYWPFSSGYTELDLDSS